MALTPEGKVKKAVKDVLAKYEPINAFWPVQTGYGKKHVDCIVCYRGRYIAIETKGPGKEPTPLQDRELESVKAANGVAMVIGGKRPTHTLEDLENVLKFLSTTQPL